MVCTVQNMGYEANIFVHEKCRKDYTQSRNIKQQKRKAEEEAAAVAGPSTPKEQTFCSVIEVFNFYTRCLFWGEEVDEENEKKKRIKYQKKIVKVCILEFKGTVLRMCNDRKDPQGCITEKRLTNIRDLFAEEALYQDDCRKTFFTVLPACHSAVG